MPIGTIHPCGDYVLVRPLLAEERSAGGVILPDQTRENLTQTGQVVAVGPALRPPRDGEDPVPLDVEVGQTVVLASRHQIEVHWGGERYFMVHGKDLLGVLV